MSTVSIGVPPPLDLEAVHSHSAALHDLARQNREASSQASQKARRVRADSRRIRGELVRVGLPREPTCSAIARRLVEEHLAEHAPDEIADAKMVVSELVSNAFVHGEGAPSGSGSSTTDTPSDVRGTRLSAIIPA